MNIVIIGASFAGLSAALECRKLYKNAHITLIDREKDVAYFPNTLNWKGQEKFLVGKKRRFLCSVRCSMQLFLVFLKQNVSQFIPKCER
ncbi:FAD-dependent oxidoreductase [Streptococcus suis]|uniref:Pyridine nucleotide-disulfide family oxidoreductase n=1 Tax=Streptococcus suis TaxID=1307 RepID=A0A123VBV2_STRSU|nr:FAD/NAD(P)-binding oxidoreductase [Streptococcus suis]CYU62609.1 pyridine nucleotide-disulfide family oxidoreductase [Streptococcus suis]CYX32277.1 pyridine nucleotide-disulfide family oxidoreductase [Streptococcus suis]